MTVSDPAKRDLWELWHRWSEDGSFDHLRDTGARFVPGVGHWDHPVVAIVGEAPGAKEDEQGTPFVGPAGQLLDELLETIGLARESIWITNVVKYRPPNNRQPTWPERIAARPLLRDEMKIVNPSIVVPVGATAWSLIDSTSISTAHGQVHRRGRWVYLPMFHPSYLMRRRDLRPLAEGDMLTLAELIKEES